MWNNVLDMSMTHHQYLAPVIARQYPEDKGTEEKETAGRNQN
jgi:hypothetical protein